MNLNAKATAIISCCIAALAGLVVMLTLTIWRTTPAQFLPAEQTLAYLQNVTAEQLKAANTWLPELDLPETDYQNQTVALLKANSGSYVTVIFLDRNNSTESPTAGKFAVRTNELGHSLLTDVKNPLKRSQSFKAISKHLKSEQWAYFAREALMEPAGWPQSLIHSLIVQDDDFFGISYQTAPSTLVAFSPLSKNETTIETFKNEPDTWFFARCNNLNSAWQNLLNNLSNAKQVELLSLVKHRTETTFGNNVSFELELLPLLSNTSDLNINTSQTGGTTFTLTGNHNNPKQVAALLDRLHEGIIQAAPTVEVSHFTFDDRFSSTALRMIDEATQKKLFKKQGYQGQTTNTLDATLTTLWNKNIYLITNRSLVSNLQSPASNLQSQLTCQGTLDIKTIAKKFGLLIKATPPYHPLAPGIELPLNWQQLQTGPIREVVFSPALL